MNYKVVTPVAWNDNSVRKRGVRIGDYEVIFEDKVGDDIENHYYGLVREARHLQERVDNLECFLESAKTQANDFKESYEYYKKEYNKKYEDCKRLEEEKKTIDINLTQALGSLEIYKKLAADYQAMYEELDRDRDRLKNDIAKLYYMIPDSQRPPYKSNWRW